MTGPEHYREAEVYLRGASDRCEAAGEVDAFATYLLAAAQVHATLAAAAATAATFTTEFAELDDHERQAPDVERPDRAALAELARDLERVAL